jgi:hypothetical protein
MKKILFLLTFAAGISATAQVKVGTNPTVLAANANFQVEGTATTNQLVVLKNGNVGIGTTAPTATLHLAGNQKIDGNNTLEFGAGVAGKEGNAGKIGYGTFGDELAIVGAGATGSPRKIRFWDAVGIGMSPVVNNGLELAAGVEFRKYFNSTGGTTYMKMINNDGSANFSEYFNSTGTTAPTAVLEGGAFRRIYGVNLIAGDEAFVYQYANQVAAGAAQTWKNYIRMSSHFDLLSLNPAGNISVGTDYFAKAKMSFGGSHNNGLNQFTDPVYGVRNDVLAIHDDNNTGQYGFGIHGGTLETYAPDGQRLMFAHRSATGNLTNRLFISDTGNVGVNTVSPSNKFEVVGSGNNTFFVNKGTEGNFGDGYGSSFNITGGTSNVSGGQRAFTIHGQVNPSNLVEWYSRPGGVYTVGIVQDANANIGIGTGTPTAQLHTTGSVRFGGAGTPALGKVLTSDASGNATWQTASVAGLNVDTVSAAVAAPVYQTVNSGSIQFATTNQGIIMKSADGTNWKLTIANNGVLTVVKVIP